MRPVEKALWFIESHFAEDVALADVAKLAGVSRHYMTRAFGAATGHSVMRYVRGRRLTGAAQSLSNGEPDILGVALDAGYGSHEAFTRAFRDQFGVTPEAVRARRNLDNLTLVEPARMDESLLASLEPPRFEHGKVLLIAGLSERYSWETGAGIPAQWQRFQAHIGQIPRRVGEITYGVCSNGDDEGNFDYVCGVEVGGFSMLPPGLARVRVPARRYVVFSHRDHISTIRRIVNTIWNKWLPDSGQAAADAPNFERYDTSFDPHTGIGGLEIRIPLRA